MNLRWIQRSSAHSVVRKLLAYCSVHDVSGDTISETRIDTLTLNVEIASHLDTQEEEQEEEEDSYLPILSKSAWDWVWECHFLESLTINSSAIDCEPTNTATEKRQKDKQALDGDERKQSRPFVHSFRIDSATFVFVLFPCHSALECSINLIRIPCFMVSGFQ